MLGCFCADEAVDLPGEVRLREETIELEEVHRVNAEVRQHSDHFYTDFCLLIGARLFLEVAGHLVTQ